MLFKKVVAIRYYAGGGAGGAQIPLLDNEFEYEICPNTVEIILKNMTIEGLKAFKFKEISSVTIVQDNEIENRLDLKVLRAHTPEHEKEEYR